jgi:uncharacterized protein (TIGR02996 family)
MTDAPAFFRAIEAEPDDDTPRLVYADWLDENAASDADRARAEFIRVQCARERETRRARRARLLAREGALLEEYQDEWATAYPVRVPRSVYTRGFVPFTISAAQFAKHGEQLAAAAPLDFLRLTNASKTMAGMAACPALRYVRYLTIESNGLQNHHLSLLFDSPRVLNVRILALGNNSIKSAGCETLAATTALPALGVLGLGGNPIKDQGFEALMDAPWFANLVGLYIPGCQVSAAAVTRLAKHPAAKRLRSLNVTDWADRDDTTARAILDSPHLSKLERLWYPYHALSAPVREALRTRFGANLNLPSYRLDWNDGGGA